MLMHCSIRGLDGSREGDDGNAVTRVAHAAYANAEVQVLLFERFNVFFFSMAEVSDSAQLYPRSGGVAANMT